ncbi:hypothetical protein BT63DRAFT_409129 [Microthyrium microscopicum]|uniref:Uncharacterized protein n=1 Tax=Microthyrium microscopicum TaxID=703497 RepID=A0A6A6UTA7_9PEZI|nr:hypothetical protein BT63DRAFT_409129 [Microthyrium microscopicum]
MSKKDMKRHDLIIPYTEPAKAKDEPDMSSALSSTLPMIAIITRNKMLGWTAVLFALQGWLVQTPAQAAAAGTPAYFSFVMAAMSLGMSYLPLFFPPAANRMGSGTEPPAPQPLV